MVVKDTYTMCKTVHVLEPSKVHPYTPQEKKYLYQPLPPTPPLKSNKEEPVSIPSISSEVKNDTVCVAEPPTSTTSEEPQSSNTLVSVQATPFIKTPLHRTLCFGTYVGTVVGLSAALLYHLRYELTNPNLLPVHMLMLLIGFKLLYAVRHFK